MESVIIKSYPFNFQMNKCVDSLRYLMSVSAAWTSDSFLSVTTKERIALMTKFY